MLQEEAEARAAATGIMPPGWVGRRRWRDPMELTDRLNPTIAELTQVIEQEVEKCPEAK